MRLADIKAGMEVLGLTMQWGLGPELGTLGKIDHSPRVPTVQPPRSFLSPSSTYVPNLLLGAELCPPRSVY